MSLYLEHVVCDTVRVHQVKEYEITTVPVTGLDCVCTTIIIKTDDGDKPTEIKLFIDNKYVSANMANPPAITGENNDQGETNHE